MKRTNSMNIENKEVKQASKSYNLGMKRLITLIILAGMMTLSTYAQISEDQLRAKLEAIYSGKTQVDVGEKTFITTDKDIYAPGEVIRYKADVIDALNQQPTQVPEMIVVLRYASGQIIHDEKVTLKQGVAVGTIQIDDRQSEGFAFLVAYTPHALKTNDASLVAVKPILINGLKTNDYVLQVESPTSVIRSGDDFQFSVTLNAITPSNKKEKIQAELYDYDRSVIQEKQIINPGTAIPFKLKVPAENNGGLYVDLTVGDETEKRTLLPVYTTNDNIQIEFYPEGGHLLTNTMQKIVYRVTDAFGQPLSIAGNIYDKNHNHVGMGKPIKPGFGLISLMPTYNQEYTFEIEDKHAKDRKFKLPEATKDGVAFTYLRRDNLGIRAQILATGEAIGSDVFVAAIARGKIELVTQLRLKGETEVRFSPESLSTGVNHFLVYNLNGELISERLVYIDPAPVLPIKLLLSSEKVKAGDSLQLSIDIPELDPELGSITFDVSVVDQQNLFVKQQPLVPTNLRYQLETPFPQTVVELYLTNLELIANTVKNFGIYNLNNPYSTERKLTTLTGQVCNKHGKPVAGASVMFMNSEKPTLLTTKADSNGRFKFENIARTENLKIKAFGANEKKTYQVKIDHSFEETLDNIIMREAFMNNQPYRFAETKSYFEKHARVFNQMVDNSRKSAVKVQNNYTKMLESGTEVLSVIKMMKPFNLVNNQIVFYGSTNSLMYQTGALIVIDGNKIGTDIGALNSLSPSQVATINILTDLTSVQLYTALNPVGVIVITTKGSKDDKEQYYTNSNTAEIQRQKTNENAILQLRKDYATTLLYETGLIGKSGRLNTINIFTNKMESTYLVRVKATTQSGEIGYAEIIFQTY